MPKRTRTHTTVRLPWEYKSRFFAELLSGRRWWPIVTLIGLSVALFFIWKVADQRARIRVTRATIAEVDRAIVLFRSEIGRCPRTTTELVHPPKTSAHYLDELPDDGWGNQLYIRCLGGPFSRKTRIISAGPSGSFAKSDNVY